ncbi:reverse transcriptase domain-containing protein [Tanacetum coccineum]
MPKFNKWLSTLLRNKEKLEEIAITTVNAECSAIILNKVLEKLEDPRKFLILCALQELERTNALADSEASINLLPHSIYKKLGLGALKPTRMTLELVNRSVTHPMGIAEDVVVRVDGFTFLADFVVVKHTRTMGIALGILTEVTQSVTSRIAMLAIRVRLNLIQRLKMTLKCLME